jgi:lipopolysaccharide transport system permease protein
VIYPTPTEGWAALVTQINPVTPLLVTTRQLLTGAELTQLVPFVTVTVVTLVLSLLSWILFRLAMPHLIERIGS